MNRSFSLGEIIISFPVKQLHRNVASEAPQDCDRPLVCYSFGASTLVSCTACMRCASPSSPQGADRQGWKGHVLPQTLLKDLVQFPSPSSNPVLCNELGRETAWEQKKRPLPALSQIFVSCSPATLFLNTHLLLYWNTARKYISAQCNTQLALSPAPASISLFSPAGIKIISCKVAYTCF